MLQVRSSGTEGDKRWYCPERDLVYAFPELISKSLRSMFRDSYDVKGLSPEEFGRECQVLRFLLFKCQSGEITPEDLIKGYQEIHPKVREVLSAGFFAAMLGAYLEWCAYVRPREPGDAKLTVDSVEEAIDGFLKLWSIRAKEVSH